MNRIINDHPTGTHPFAISLRSEDVTTENGIDHRELTENNHNDVLLDYMVPALQKHHISQQNLQRRKDLLQSLRISDAAITQSPYPHNPSTQKGNFA